MKLKKYYDLIDKCKICGSKKYELIFTVKLKLFRKFELLKCLNCSVIFTSPSIKKKYIKKLYFKEYFFIKDIDINRQINVLRDIRSQKYFQKIRLKNKKIKSVLDYGCGDALFFKNLSNNYKSINFYNSDFYSKPPKYVVNSNNKNLFYHKDSELFKKKNKNRYDIIFLRHVLEHVKTPLDICKKLSNLLTVNGQIIIEVPNNEYYGFNLFKKDYSLLGINDTEGPVHLWHFNQKSIINCFSENFKINFYKNNFFITSPVLGASILNLINKKWIDRHPSLINIIFFIFIQFPIDNLINNHPILLFSLTKKN